MGNAKAASLREKACKHSVALRQRPGSPTAARRRAGPTPLAAWLPPPWPRCMQVGKVGKLDTDGVKSDTKPGNRTRDISKSDASTSVRTEAKTGATWPKMSKA